MNLYSIAGLTVQLNCKSITMQRAEKYRITGNTDIVPDISIETHIEDIPPLRPGIIMTDEIKFYCYEGMVFYQKLVRSFSGIMLHASAVVVDNKAYLFSAPSGTGKSTHTCKWLELFGNRAYILNDDKPALRVLSDGIYAYGTPWSGKNDISVNKCVPVQGICFLQRDDHNWIEPMNNYEAFINIYSETISRLDKTEALNASVIIQKIVDNIPIYSMGCTPTTEAAEMAYKAMKA